MTTESPLVRHPLTYLRASRGWTLSDLADLVKRRANLNMAAHRQKVYRWERGVVPELAAQYAIADELGISHQTVLDLPWPAWLLLVDGVEYLDAPWTDEVATLALSKGADADVDRRAFLTLTSQTAMSLAAGWADALPPPQKIAYALSTGRIDSEVVAWLERRLEQLWHLDDLIGGKECLDLARADMRMLRRVLDRSHRSDIEYRLWSVGAELSRFSGWAAFDGGYHAAAERYWHGGLRASAQAGNREIGAYILSQMAMQRTYAGDGHTAINLLEVARDSVSGHTSRTVLAMLDAWQVRAHAVAGESKLAAQILNRADDHWDHRSPSEDPPWIYWMRRPSQTIEVGMAFVSLGEPEQATRLLEDGMLERTSDYGRDTVLAMSAIARALLDQHDLEGAANAAQRAFEIAQSVGSTRAIDELDTVFQRFPRGALSVQD